MEFQRDNSFQNHQLLSRGVGTPTNHAPPSNPLQISVDYGGKTHVIPLHENDTPVQIAYRICVVSNWDLNNIQPFSVAIKNAIEEQLNQFLSQRQTSASKINNYEAPISPLKDQRSVLTPISKNHSFSPVQAIKYNQISTPVKSTTQSNQGQFQCNQNMIDSFSKFQNNLIQPPVSLKAGSDSKSANSGAIPSQEKLMYMSMQKNLNFNQVNQNNQDYLSANNQTRGNQPHIKKHTKDLPQQQTQEIRENMQNQRQFPSDINIDSTISVILKEFQDDSAFVSGDKDFTQQYTPSSGDKQFMFSNGLKSVSNNNNGNNYNTGKRVLTELDDTKNFFSNIKMKSNGISQNSQSPMNHPVYSPCNTLNKQQENNDIYISALKEQSFFRNERETSQKQQNHHKDDLVISENTSSDFYKILYNNLQNDNKTQYQKSATGDYELQIDEYKNRVTKTQEQHIQSQISVDDHSSNQNGEKYRLQTVPDNFQYQSVGGISNQVKINGSSIEQKPKVFRDSSTQMPTLESNYSSNTALEPQKRSSNSGNWRLKDQGQKYRNSSITENQYTFHPKINENSKKMVRRQSNKSAFEDLYEKGVKQIRLNQLQASINRESASLEPLRIKTNDLSRCVEEEQPENYHDRDAMKRKMIFRSNSSALIEKKLKEEKYNISSTQFVLNKPGLDGFDRNTPSNKNETDNKLKFTTMIQNKSSNKNILPTYEQRRQSNSSLDQKLREVKKLTHLEIDTKLKPKELQISYTKKPGNSTILTTPKSKTSFQQQNRSFNSGSGNTLSKFQMSTKSPQNNQNSNQIHENHQLTQFNQFFEYLCMEKNDSMISLNHIDREYIPYEMRPLIKPLLDQKQEFKDQMPKQWFLQCCQKIYNSLSQKEQNDVLGYKFIETSTSQPNWLFDEIKDLSINDTQVKLKQLLSRVTQNVQSCEQNYQHFLNKLQNYDKSN